MSVQPSITIRRQIVEVDVQGHALDALGLHHRIAALCRDMLPAALEAALGPIDAGDVHLSVERLELDVSVTSVESLETDFIHGVQQGVEELLQKQAVLAGGLARRSAGEAVDEAFLEFLRTGRLPWWFALPAGVALEDDFVATWQGSSAGMAQRRAHLLRQAFADPVARHRAAAQFSDGFLSAILGAMASDPAATMQAVGGLRDPAAVREAWVAALAAASTGDPEAGVPDETPAGPSTSSGHGASPDAPSRTAPGPATSPEHEARGSGHSDVRMGSPNQGREPGIGPSLTEGTPDVLGEAGSPDLSISSGNPHQSANPAAASHSPSEPEGVGARQVPGEPEPLPWASGVSTDPLHAPASDLSPAPRPLATSDTTELREGILVDLAGLALLYPFLPRFLEALGASTQHHVTDPDRSVCLLHLLATGERVAPEHRVTFAKVLCGVPLDAVVRADVGITDAEVEEAEALLAAAISHWGALGNTSPDGLRAEFLMRPGLLVLDADEHWLLRVEPATSDILLGVLPWTVSMIGLPWLERPLRVEWG